MQKAAYSKTKLFLFTLEPFCIILRNINNTLCEESKVYLEPRIFWVESEVFLWVSRNVAETMRRISRSFRGQTKKNHNWKIRLMALASMNRESHVGLLFFSSIHSLSFSEIFTTSSKCFLHIMEYAWYISIIVKRKVKILKEKIVFLKLNIVALQWENF